LRRASRGGSQCLTFPAADALVRPVRVNQIWPNCWAQPDLRVGAGGVSVRPRGQLVFNRQRTDTKMTIAAERLAVIAAIISLSSVMA
jgi:hypothetical protein